MIDMKLDKTLLCFILISLIPLVSGCAAVAVGGAATVGATATDRRTTGTVIEDQTIEIKASQAFGKDEELNKQAHLNVTSYNTIVLLTGETPTDAMRQRAMELVKGVEKVTHVYNEITIAAPS